VHPFAEFNAMAYLPGQPGLTHTFASNPETKHDRKYALSAISHSLHGSRVGCWRGKMMPEVTDEDGDTVRWAQPWEGGRQRYSWPTKPALDTSIVH